MVESGTFFSATKDSAEELCRIGNLANRVGINWNNLLSKICSTAECDSISHEWACNFITQATEFITIIGIIPALETIGNSAIRFEYNSVYNRRSPRNGTNDKGADIVLFLSNGKKVAIEVEQRKGGYTIYRDYLKEVAEKLRRERADVNVYVFYNGYDNSSLQEIESWGRANDITTFSLSPVPYIKQGNVYRFNLPNLLHWLLATEKSLIRTVQRFWKGLDKCRLPLPKVTESIHDHIMPKQLQLKNELAILSNTTKRTLIISVNNIRTILPALNPERFSLTAIRSAGVSNTTFGYPQGLLRVGCLTELVNCALISYQKPMETRVSCRKSLLKTRPLMILKMNKKTISSVQLICDKCHYEWQPRVSSPKFCPRCKAWLDWCTEGEDSLGENNQKLTGAIDSGQGGLR